MRYHLFQKFVVKMVKIKETSFLSTRGMTLMFGNCICEARCDYHFIHLPVHGAMRNFAVSMCVLQVKQI